MKNSQAKNKRGIVCPEELHEKSLGAIQEKIKEENLTLPMGPRLH
jgi:hypothetical protein